MTSRLKWAGHVDKMGDEKLTKGLVAETMEGKGGKKTKNVMGGLC